MDFSGRNAIITGAAMGIGFATARMIAKNGGNVLLVDINEQLLSESVESLKEYGREVYGYVCDVANEERVNSAAAFAAKKFGKIDILINNAGVYKDTYGILFENSDSSMWKRKIDINILGTLYFTRAVINGMLERGYGRIVNLSSVAGVYGIVSMADYSMSKGAILGFTKALAKEVSERGVTVNAVSPGGINDDLKANAQLSFMNRSGSNDECANLICFLADESAAYISGVNYIIDGCRKKM
ncbi:MAG: SDR family oxidoreductase [Clostridiales bacterium]|nr:SDR family oxidoreductase [Clostridiales bacterium]